MAYWSPFPDMDSSELTTTEFIDQLEQQQQQQQLNPASSEDASTSLNDGFQKFFVDPALAMPLFSDPFRQDFANADNLVQPPTEGQAELDKCGIDSMAEEISWANQDTFAAWDIVSQQAEVRPGANTLWPSEPFGANQSGIYLTHQETPSMPHVFSDTDEQLSPNNLAGIGPEIAYIPVYAGSDFSQHKSPIGRTPPRSDQATDLVGSSLHVQQGDRYLCLFESCSKSFTRLPDLFRHQNAYHLQSTSFWCGHPGCARAGPYGRPFPRKDKRNDHERKVHGITVHNDY